MAGRRLERNVWFCQRCGSTFDRSDRDPTYACGYCTNGRMTSAVVRWMEEIPDPDPLAVLLVDDALVSADMREEE